MSSAEESILLPVTSLLGTCMQALVRKIERTNAPGNLDGLFAYHVIGNEPDFTLTWSVNVATEQWLAKNNQRLSHFHVLAVAGYALWHFENTAPTALRKAFTDGLAMLRLRDPFPEDRNSFAYQPRAFLGIALGVTTLGEPGATYHSWLVELLDPRDAQRGRNKQASRDRNLHGSLKDDSFPYSGETSPRFTGTSHR